MHQPLRLKSLAWLLLASANAIAASSLPPLPPPAPAVPAASVELNFSRGVPLSEFCRIVLEDVLSVPFVLSQDVLQSTVVVGVHAVRRSPKDAESILRQVLTSNDFVVEVVGRIHYVRKVPPKPVDAVTTVDFDYRPKHHRISYFASSLPAAFPEATFSFGKGGVKDDASAGLRVFHIRAPVKDKQAMLSFIRELDQPSPQVLVRAFLVDVSTDARDARGVQLVTNLLGSKLSVQAGTAVSTNTIRFSVPSLDILASALNANSGFRTSASPVLVLENGESGKLLGGAQVPVLSGTTTAPGSGAVSQSIEYRDTGTNLTVTPTVIGSQISLSVSLEVSDAVATSTGVSSSPTLLTRSASSRITLQNKSALVMGGLVSEKTSDTSNSFLGLIPFSRERSSSRSETVLVLYAELVEAALPAPGDRADAPAQSGPLGLVGPH